VIIKTQKLRPTQTKHGRMRATAENGATLTIPTPAHNPDHHVALTLARAYGYDTVEAIAPKTYRAYVYDPDNERLEET